MSGKISGQVWDLDLPQRELLVLLAITDHADHDGCNMFPSIALLAWKTGYSQRTVIRILNGLVNRDILIRHTRAGKPTIYDANLDAAPKKADRPKTEKKRKTHDKALSYDIAMSVVTTSPVMKSDGYDTASRNVRHETSVKETSEYTLAPEQPRSNIVPFVPQPDGGARAYSLIEAWLDAWDITEPRYRKGTHGTQRKAADQLADMEATPDDIAAMCAERRAKGKQPDEAKLAFLASDFVGWKSRRETSAPAPVDPAISAAVRAADDEWERERQDYIARLAGGAS